MNTVSTTSAALPRAAAHSADVDAWLALAGRVLIAVLFLPDGIGKVFRFGFISGMVAGKGLPLPELVTCAVIALEVLASLALLAGFRTRWAAVALAIFSLLAAVLFHDFWAAPANMAVFQQISFFKNIGLAGGLLVLAALGPGRMSLDARRSAG
jgi:putative oxidoreductase